MLYVFQVFSSGLNLAAKSGADWGSDWAYIILLAAGQEIFNFDVNYDKILIEIEQFMNKIQTQSFNKFTSTKFSTNNPMMRRCNIHLMN